MICRGQKNAHGKMPLCRVPKTKALGKDAFCHVPKNSTRQNTSFAECQKKGTRQRRILPSAEKWHSAKYIFAECLKKHSAKPFLQSAEKNTWQSHLCRVPDKKHSAKLPALGKVPVSSSVYYTKPRVNCLFEALNEFKSKSGQLQSFISFRDLQFSFRKFFHPRSFEKFEISNLRFKRSFA